MISWMMEGNRNTSFFHRIASGRKKHNTVEEILDGNGVMCSDEGEVKCIFVEYFTGIFTAKESLNMTEALRGCGKKGNGGDVTCVISAIYGG